MPARAASVVVVLEGGLVGPDVFAGVVETWSVPDELAGADSCGCFAGLDETGARELLCPDRGADPPTGGALKPEGTMPEVTAPDEPIADSIPGFSCVAFSASSSWLATS